MPNSSDPNSSVHFSVEELDEHVFAAVHRSGGWAISNAGIVDLGYACLDFDTFMTVQAARDLRNTAERLTSSPIRFVINSHYHNDHIWGNQVFRPDALILSSAITLDQIRVKGQEEFEWYRENSPKRLTELEAQLDRQDTDQDAGDLDFWIEYYRSLVKSMPLLSVEHPQLTFKDDLTIPGSDFDVELITFNGAHTGSDTILWLPSKGIAFMADLLFVQCHPYLPDGDATEYLSVLDVITEMGPTTLVPGHGPVAGMPDVDAMKRYIIHCEDVAQSLFDRGVSLDDRPSLTVPEEYSSWEYPSFYAANVFHLLGKYTAEA